MQDNGFYDMETFKNYSDLFKIYIENKNFVNHGDSEKWFEIIRNLPNLHTDYLEVSDSQIVIGDPKEINVKNKKIPRNTYDAIKSMEKGPFNLLELRLTQSGDRIKNGKELKIICLVIEV